MAKNCEIPPTNVTPQAGDKRSIASMQSFPMPSKTDLDYSAAPLNAGPADLNAPCVGGQIADRLQIMQSDSAACRRCRLTVKVTKGPM